MGIEMRQITVTRPADTNAYTAGDAISDKTSAPSDIKVTDAGRGYIVGVIAQWDTVDITPRHRLFLHNSAPTQIADNAAAPSPLAADSARFRGYIDIGAMTSSGVGSDDSSHAQNVTVRHPIDSSNFYLIVQTLDAFTPESAAVLTLTFLIERGA